MNPLQNLTNLSRFIAVFGALLVAVHLSVDVVSVGGWKHTTIHINAN
jgi:hypothetical protein